MPSSLKDLTKKMVSGKKSTAKTKAVPSLLSAEKVNDSDEESTDEPSNENRKSSLAKVAPKPTSTVAKINGKKVIPFAPKPKTNVPKANGKRKAPAVPESESESESESSSSEEENAGKKQTVDNEDEKSSEGDVYEEDDEEEEEEEEQEAPTASKTKPLRQEPKTHEVLEKPAPYQPPRGFDSRTLKADDEDEGPQATELFSKSNLKGKQIWYIIAPASVPIASIKKLSLKDLSKRKAVTSHNGTEYGFAEDSSKDKEFTNIMVPNPADGGYCARRNPIDKILHLQQVVKLQGAEEGAISTSIPESAVFATKRPARKQPSGLKMRFRPIGFGSGDIGLIGSTDDESDTEMPSAPRIFQNPDSASSDDSDSEIADTPAILPKIAILPPKSKELKRKHSEGSLKKHSSSQLESHTPKKSKKKEKHSQSSTGDSQPKSIDTPKSAKKSKDKDRRRNNYTDNTENADDF